MRSWKKVSGMVSHDLGPSLQNLYLFPRTYSEINQVKVVIDLKIMGLYHFRTIWSLIYILLTLLIPTSILMLEYQGGVKFDPPAKSNFCGRNHVFSSWGQILHKLSLILMYNTCSWLNFDEFLKFYVKNEKNSNFFENWGICTFYTSKERWNHLEIEIMVKRNNFFKD